MQNLTLQPNLTTQSRQSKKLLEVVVRRLVGIVVLFVFMLLGVQFVILSTVGTSGPELSRLRKEREKLELDSELKQSQVREFQTSAVVTKTAKDDLSMKATKVNRLTSTDNSNSYANAR